MMIKRYYALFTCGLFLLTIVLLLPSTFFTLQAYAQTACANAGGACTTIGICNLNCVPNPVPGMPACGGAVYGCPAAQPACCNPQCPAGTYAPNCTPCPAGQTNPHNACTGTFCASVAGCGSSNCSPAGSSCGINPPPTQPPPPGSGCPSGQTNPHGVCNGGNPNICQSVPGCGNNACTIGSTCPVSNPPPIAPPVPPESSPLWYNPIDSVRDTTFVGVFILGIGLLLSHL